MIGVRAAAKQPFARVLVLAMTLALAAVILISGSVRAATVIGSAVGSVPCGTGIDTVQTASGGASYAVPAGGTVSAWSTQAGVDAGPAALLVWRPTATPGTYMLVGESPLVTLTAGTLNTFNLSKPIAVNAGDLIGLRLEGPLECAQAGTSGDTFGYSVGPTPAVNASEAMLPNTGFTLDVAATMGSAATVPTNKNQCKGRGWQHLTNASGTPFKSRAACIRFVTAEVEPTPAEHDPTPAPETPTSADQNKDKN